jgi:hypothetical protein
MLTNNDQFKDHTSSARRGLLGRPAAMSSLWTKLMVSIWQQPLGAAVRMSSEQLITGKGHISFAGSRG